MASLLSKSRTALVLGLKRYAPFAFPTLYVPRFDDSHG